MIHHYLTKYYDEEKAKYVAESWIQINILGFCWCISKRSIEITPKVKIDGHEFARSIKADL